MLYKHCVGSFARVLSFMQAAALGSMGSQLPFAAIRLNVRFADLAAICCTLHHSLVLTICDFGYDAWQAEISN